MLQEGKGKAQSSAAVRQAGAACPLAPAHSTAELTLQTPLQLSQLLFLVWEAPAHLSNWVKTGPERKKKRHEGGSDDQREASRSFLSGNKAENNILCPILLQLHGDKWVAMKVTKR